MPESYESGRRSKKPPMILLVLGLIAIAGGLIITEVKHNVKGPAAIVVGCVIVVVWIVIRLRSRLHR